MTQEVLKLALEALEEIALAGMSGTGQESERAMTEWHARQAWKFIGIAARQRTAIKEALRENAMREVQRLGQEIEQEPVACIYKNYLFMAHEFQSCQVPVDSQPLYTHPSQRTWVGLTDDDRNQIARKANYHWEMTTSEYADRIGELTEAKLKEKNT